MALNYVIPSTQSFHVFLVQILLQKKLLFCFYQIFSTQYTSYQKHIFWKLFPCLPYILFRSLPPQCCIALVVLIQRRVPTTCREERLDAVDDEKDCETLDFSCILYDAFNSTSQCLFVTPCECVCFFSLVDVHACMWKYMQLTHRWRV